MVLICKIWLVCGIVGWLLGIIGDMFLYKQKAIRSPLLIIGGPFILWLTMSSVVWRIIYAIKKKKSNRKYN